MKYLFLAAFLVLSALHLYASYLDDRKQRAKTKPFLLIALVLFYIFASKHPSPLLIAALLFSWLGDVLLIPKGHKWFIAGGVAFMFGHLFFILAYTRNISFSGQPWLLIIPFALVLLGIALKIIMMVKETTPKVMVPAMYFYLICNSLMNVFALMQMCTRHTAGSVAAFAGALLFFISDCTLFLVRYYKKPEIVYKKHFTVMLTYLLGELLIVLGVLAVRG